MELGINGLNAKATLGPAETIRLARLAEELGYRSWWAGEHVVLHLGVDRLVVYPLPLEHPAEAAAFIERHAYLPH